MAALGHLLPAQLLPKGDSFWLSNGSPSNIPTRKIVKYKYIYSVFSSGTAVLTASNMMMGSFHCA